MAQFKLAINPYSKSPCTLSKELTLERSKMDEIKIIPLLIKHVGILMVLIKSIFVVELYIFFMNFRERVADIVSW